MKIEFTIDPRSEPFQTNPAAMVKVVARPYSKQGGGAKHAHPISARLRSGTGENMKIETTIDPRPEPYRANRAAMVQAVARLHSELARSKQGGGAKIRPSY